MSVKTPLSETRAAAPAGPEVERSLAASRREGVAAQVPVSLLDYYLVPYALHLGASAAQVGLLVALPNLLSAVSQFFVVDVLRAANGRRRLLLWGVALQIAALAPLAALPALPGLGEELRVNAAFASVAAFRVLGAIMGPAWGSLMSDYLPPGRRGDYFGRRSRLVGVAGMLAAAGGGALLHGLRHAMPGFSFALLFGAGAVSRAASFPYMRRLAETPGHDGDQGRFEWRDWRARLRRSNFARFMIYVSAVTFAAQLSSAYLGVHMLRDLGFDYVSYMGVLLASAAAAFLAFPSWGRHADVVGNAHVLRFTSFLVPVMPLLWCLTESAWSLGLVELLGGFVWAGFNLCATNFVYDAVPPHKRVRALGYYNLTNGAAVFLGAALGGWLADRLPATLGYRLHTLFLLSAALRLAAHFVLSRHFEEARQGARRVRSRELFYSVVGLRPLVGESRDEDFEGPGKS